MANHVHSAPRTMLATTALLLMTSLVSAEPALALASPTSLDTVVGNTLGILTQIPGRIVSGIAPLTQLLDPMLFELLGQSGLSVLPSGVTSLLTTIVADLVNTALPVPPPFRPDDEARRFGFLAESFNLTTPDGYILENFRIRNGSCPQYRAVLVVPPSVLANTAAFLLIEEQSLVWRLARECYDVYLLNCRGMLFARNHVELSDQSNEFWDFDQKEYAEDVALGMDFVYNRTGGRRMRMVALDQGGTSFFITNAFMDRRYQDMLASAYLYVPIANLGNLKSIAFSTLSAVRDALSAAGTLVLHDELAFMNPTIHSVLYNLCGRFAPTTCNYLLQFLGGPGELNTEKFSYSFRNVLDSTSIKAFNFYLNMIGNDGYFKLYDYGSGNLEKYGTANPPDIPLNATTVPCTVFALTASTVTVTQDVRSTFARLAPSAQHRYVELENLDSLAPLVPLRPDVVYDPLLEALEEDLTAIPE